MIKDKILVSKESLERLLLYLEVDEKAHFQKCLLNKQSIKRHVYVDICKLKKEIKISFEWTLDKLFGAIFNSTNLELDSLFGINKWHRGNNILILHKIVLLMR